MSEIDPNHARPLDVHRWSDHAKAKELRDAVCNQHLKDALTEGSKGKKAHEKFTTQ